MSFVFFCLFLLFPRQTYFSSLLFTLPAQQWKLIHFSCGCSSSVFVCIVQASAQIMILHSHASYRIKWWNSLNYYSTNGKFHFFAFFASNYLRSIETLSNYLLWNCIFLLNHLINLKILEYEIKTVSFFFKMVRHLLVPGIDSFLQIATLHSIISNKLNDLIESSHQNAHPITSTCWKCLWAIEKALETILGKKNKKQRIEEK